MASIQTAIQLNDQFSGVLNNIISSVNLTLAAMQDMQQSMSAGIDTSSIDGAREHISQATAALNELNEAASQQTAPAAGGYEQIADAAEDAGQEIRDNITSQERFNSTVQAGSNHVRSFVQAMAGMSIVRTALNVVTGQIGSAISRMDTMTNYNRTMTAITGNADMASASLDRLKDITQGTAYGLDTAAKATQNFVTRGISIGSASAEVGKWADAVAFYGDGTNESLTSVTDALGKMLSKGKVEMDQLDRLTDAGINAVGIYAQATGQSASSVQDDLSQGVISAQEFITTVSTAFTEGTNGVMNISGAAKEAGGTWATSIANAKAAVTRGVISMIDGINQGLENAGFGTILNGIQQLGAGAENVLNQIGTIASTTITLLSPVLNMIRDAAQFIADNWSVISPIIYGVVAALMAYMIISTIVATINGIMAMAEGVKTAAQMMATGATFAETAAQQGLNAALLACPLAWIIMLIIALIAVIIAVANHIAKTGDTATTAFGVICGWVFVAGAAFKNLWFLVGNVALGIWEAMKACAENMRAAFHNAISNIKSWFYGLMSAALTTIGSICEALNKLPFIEFDYSGITSAADEYAAKASSQADDKLSYLSVADAFNKGASTFDAFQDGWAKDAYASGANWGDGAWNKFKDRFSKDEGDDKKDQPELPEGFSGESGNDGTGGKDAAGSDAAKTAANTGDTADNTAAIAKSLDITNEELKYLRDIAERDTVNRFTTASIRVEMTNHNKIESGQDLDGIVSTLTAKIEDAMVRSAEGVHI